MSSLLIHERHRHRYEFNNQFRQQFAANGLDVTGTSPNGQLVEVIELRDHPWFLAVQCHPEFKSKPTNAQSALSEFHPSQFGARGRSKKRIPKGQNHGNSDSSSTVLTNKGRPQYLSGDRRQIAGC